MEYYMPVRLHTGRGCIIKNGGALLELGTSCMVVTGARSAKDNGALDDVFRALEANHISGFLWDGITANPPLSDCVAAGQRAADDKVAFVLGVGGGSVLDATKAIAVFAANPTLDEPGFYAKNWQSPPLPIALVGTTAGTGSEVTKVAVLTDAAKRKHSIHDDRLYASVSFGDSQHTHSCPSDVTLSCGVDVIAHATESYFSRKADEISRAFAVRAVRLAMGPLTAAADGITLTPDQRRQLYEASLLGGLAINTTGTCFPHNVGYFLTEALGIPHGFASATFLPDMLTRVHEYDPSYAETFYSEVGTTEKGLTNLIEGCLPKSAIHLSDQAIDVALPRWEQNASVANTRATVPVEAIREMLRSLNDRS